METRTGIAWGRDFAARIGQEEFTVHSVFRTVCNLQADPAKPLLCLVTRPEALGPNALLLSGAFVPRGLRQGDRVKFAAGLLQSATAVIDCSAISSWEARRWDYNPRPEVYKLVAEWLERQAPGLSKAQSEAVRQLAACLLAADRERLKAVLTGFIGLGEGLTPSGDDFVAGVLLSYALGSRLLAATSPVAASFPALVSDFWWRTNSISQTMLWYAAQGEGAVYMLETAAALHAGSGEALDLASRLWRIGATSGRFLLSGILLGCEIFWTREQKEYGRKDLD